MKCRYCGKEGEPTLSEMKLYKILDCSCGWCWSMTLDEKIFFVGVKSGTYDENKVKDLGFNIE